MPKFAQISIIKSMRLVLYCVAVLLFVQCSKADLAVSMTDVNINSWYETATIERINEDTESLYDLNIVLHINNHFRSDDIELEVTMISPDAVRHTERVALSCDSSWEGITAHSNDIEIPYRRDVRLSTEGRYTFSLRPLTPLEGVEAAGIHFQKQ